MIEKLAMRLAHTIKQANPDQTASIEILKFSLIAVIGTGSAIILSILIAAITGKGFETCIVLLAFMLLRSVSGGYHFKSAEVCTIVSISGAVLIPHIMISESINNILMVTTILLLTLFSPKGKNQSRIFTSKHFPILKATSVVIVLSNYYFNQHILTITCFVQALSLLPLTLKGGEKSEEILE